MALDNVAVFELLQNDTLKKKVHSEILRSAQWIVANPGSFTANNIAFAYQALSHPENFVSGFMGYVVFDAQVQLDGGAVADSFIASILAANIANVWK